ncbi:MAG: hypothetical protein AB6733_16580 [Clostridiaceae bacterium]
MINSVINQQYKDSSKGTENAYFHHLSNQERKENLQQAKVEEKSNYSEAAILELGTSRAEGSNTYSLKDVYNPVRENLNNVKDQSLNNTSSIEKGIISETVTDNTNDTVVISNGSKVEINSEVNVDNGNDLLVVGNGSKVEINSKTDIDNSNDTVIIGNGSNVSINSEVGIDNGNDTVIVGNGAKVDINSVTGIDNGNDTLIIGNGAKVEINSQVGVDNGNDTLIIGNGASVKINVQAAVDNNDDTIYIGDGANVEINGSVKIDNLDDVKYDNNKITINLKDEQNRSYKWEIDVKDKKEADSIIEFLKNKSNKSWKFDELKKSVEDEKVDINSKNNNHNYNVTPFDIDTKQFNKHQFKLQLQASVVSLLMNNSMEFTSNLYKVQESKKYNLLNTNSINKFV